MAQKSIYGLIGYPVKHSLSPAMHNAAFKASGINAEYRLFELKEEGLENFFESILEKKICGFNVTVPYKEKVITFLDSVSGEAKLIGAVNTIKVTPGALAGYNTDGAGFLKHLKEGLGFNPKDKVINIIGAGGASRAICVYLAKENPKKIIICDIDVDKLNKLVFQLKENFKEVEFQCLSSVAKRNLGEADILINATPVGMKESDPLLVGAGELHSKLLVYDLIYNPPKTELLKAAESSGAKAVNGLNMLLYQGMLSFEIWTGKTAPYKEMKAALDSR